ncbi:hypothetical protein BLNAU_18512 [Blattamonas nauphoetae]|uniref:Uncharacterized protein n=1 Tax=Blattamonas nauphoetae TaxID=2049346 RepID=A0ABQ9X431_9EUKA|nr:hypothetical protein BLNAU_18512 [Blattamonas nauphoetae]
MDGDLLWIVGHKKKGILKMIGSSQIVNNVFDTLLLSFVTVDVSDSTLSSSDSLILNENGEVSIESSTFKSNNVISFIRRNIHCSNGVLNIESLSGGDGGTELSKSAWISVGDGCHFSSSVVDVHSPHFIPSLNRSKSTISRNSKTQTFTAGLVGSLLIPCGLWVEVFEWNEKTKAETGKECGS